MNAVAIRRLRLGPYWWAGGVLLALAILIGSLATPGTLSPLYVSDKIVHFVGYGALSFWFAGLLERHRYPVLAVLLVAFGVGIEGMQYAMGLGRSADWRDVVANSAGIVTSLALAYAGLGAWMFYVERRLGLS
jgi:VanZ family protein